MIRVSVYCASGDVDGFPARFDHDYYKEHACSTVEQDVVSAGRSTRASTARTSPPSSFFFESMDQFQSTMGSPGTADVMANVESTANIAPSEAESARSSTPDRASALLGFPPAALTFYEGLATDDRTHTGRK